MTASVPAYASCNGGLILNSNKFELLNSPGVATRLRNFEVAVNGGYRRVNGYETFGGTGVGTQPNGSNPILGIYPYALGVVVCSGTDVFYGEDGVSWIQVNKDTTDSGAVEASLSGLSTLPRTSQEVGSFITAKGTTDYSTNPYGVMYGATGPNELFHFRIEGTGPSRLFIFKEIGTPTNAKYIEDHDHHLCLVDMENEPNTIIYSKIDDYDDFIGIGSGKAVLADRIVGIKSFRDILYIFCQNSIHKLVNINDPSKLAVEPVTGNLGCVSNQTIQEVGGDLVYLAPDGLRTVAGTERLSDVELGSISSSIQPLLNDLLAFRSVYTFSSMVRRSKNQYRMFYLDSGGAGHGVIGTLRVSAEGILGYQWSELRDIDVYTAYSGFDDDEQEVSYHGDILGNVFVHDTGNSFNGANIRAEYKAPDSHYGDLGLRKTLAYLNTSLFTEGELSLEVQVRFDFNSSSVTQPPVISVSNSSGAATYGSAVYGTSVYGSLSDVLIRTPIQGSGHTSSLKFVSDDMNDPYIIHGYHIEIMPSGRK